MTKIVKAEALDMGPMGIYQLFAAGDVRSGSIQRVAGAVGDGATAIREVHRFLAGLRTVRLAQTYVSVDQTYVSSK